MSDPFENYSAGLESPPEHWFDITPDDDTDLAVIPRAVHAADGSGTVVLQGADGVACSFYFAQGVDYVRRPVRVLATGTTAGLGLKGVY